MNKIILPSKAIKARKWQVLTVPMILAVIGMYLVGALQASSYNPVTVINEIISEGYSLILLVLAVALFLFLEFAEGRLVELAFNDVGIQASYFHEDNKWIDWDDISQVKKTLLKLTIVENPQNKITIPLLKFSTSDRKCILEYLRENSKTAST